MSSTFGIEPYSDSSRVLSELEGLADAAAVSLGWNSSNLGALGPAWKAGRAVIVTDRKDGLLQGAVVFLRTPSAIHDADALIMLAVPAAGRESATLAFTRMTAKAHGAAGLALSVDVNAPLSFIELLGQQGFTVKAMTYGVRL